jgi:hypothetical protein
MKARPMPTAIATAGAAAVVDGAAADPPVTLPLVLRERGVHRDEGEGRVNDH